MDRHQIDLYNQALKDYDEAIQKLERIREYCNEYPQNSIGFKKNILQIIDGEDQ